MLVGLPLVFHARCLGRQVHCIDATAPDVGADLAQARWHMARPVVQQHQRRHLRLVFAQPPVEDFNRGPVGAQGLGHLADPITRDGAGETPLQRAQALKVRHAAILHECKRRGRLLEHHVVTGNHSRLHSHVCADAARCQPDFQRLHHHLHLLLVLAEEREVVAGDVNDLHRAAVLRPYGPVLVVVAVHKGAQRASGHGAEVQSRGLLSQARGVHVMPHIVIPNAEFVGGRPLSNEVLDLSHLQLLARELAPPVAEEIEALLLAHAPPLGGVLNGHVSGAQP
mmetsp:Transcript_14338/g.35955  ORF Transcript_14338/g.35955 Transcript_14338/m.35955 type:complete len:282 (-) Transcript_14338:1673-2518(-)